MTKKALGRGLEALIPKKVVTALEEQKKTGAQPIPLSKIRPNPYQPRKTFRAEDLAELVSSVKEKGVLQPILVRRRAEGWEIIAGERRFRAAQKLGLLTIPAVEVTASDVESLEIALIENLQRADLSPLEEADGYQRLVDEFQMTQEQIALKVGKDRSSVANALRLLRLAPEVKALVASGRLSAGHARVVAGVVTPLEQKKLAEKIIGQGLTVREAERWLQGQKGPVKKNKSLARGKDPNVAKLEEDLRRWLGTKVLIKTQGRHKGTLCLDYYSLDDLDRILSLFRKAGLR
ncbi:MAG TPA: ParB/RepB/Spo0J family partition protein [bacterium]|nr:ParB/RepB/Spo0J family partition protein [bacterium]